MAGGCSQFDLGLEPEELQAPVSQSNATAKDRKMATTVTFKGKSGKSYEYQVFSLWPSLKDEPGNYAFAYDSGSTISPKYFGETNSLKSRVNENHERWACAKRNGANCVCAHLTSGGVDVRRAEEQDLVDAYDPPCNRQ